MVKLSQKEKKLLACIELQAAAPLEVLQKATGLRAHSIRYYLQTLQEKGVLGPKKPLIDPQFLGYTHYTFLFSIRSHHQKLRGKLFRSLLDSPEISWIFEVGGDFHYGMAVSAKHLLQVTTLLKSIAAQFGNIFFTKSFAAQLTFLYFGRRYLYPPLGKRTALSFSIPDTVFHLDEMDQRILTLLTSVDYRSSAELARQSSIPLATLERRKKRLQDVGVIRGYFHWIDTSKLGVQSYLLLISVRGISATFRESLTQFAVKEFQVVYLTECVGEWDFELGIEVEEASMVSEFTQKLYDQLGQEILSVKVLPILKYHKVKSYSVHDAI